MKKKLGTKQEQEARRLAAGRLLLAGKKNVDVDSSVESVAVVGEAMEEDRPTRRARWIADEACRRAAAQAVQETKEDARTHPLEGCASRRVSVRLVDRETGCSSHPAEVQGGLSSASCAEDPSPTGPHAAKTPTPGATTRPRRTGALAQRRVAANKKGAARWRQPIVFLDESGFMLQPTVRRTWAPSGHTPILVESARRDRLSAIGALSISPVRRWMDFSFQLHRRNVDTSLLIPFLHALHNRLRSSGGARLGQSSGPLQDGTSTSRSSIRPGFALSTCRPIARS